jgi:hypothetical protein
VTERVPPQYWLLILALFLCILALLWVILLILAQPHVTAGTPGAMENLSMCGHAICRNSIGNN